MQLKNTFEELIFFSFALLSLTSPSHSQPSGFNNVIKPFQDSRKDYSVELSYDNQNKNIESPQNLNTDKETYIKKKSNTHNESDSEDISSVEDFLDVDNGLVIQSDIQSEKENILNAKGNVVVTYRGGILIADSVVYDKNKKYVYAEGSIQLKINKQIFEADRIEYDFLNLTGTLKQVKGLIELDNILDDLDFNFEPTELKSSQLIQRIKREKILKSPAYLKKLIFSTEELKINGNEWFAQKAFLTNDLLETEQIKLKLNSLKIYPYEEKFIVQTSYNQLIFEDKLSIPFWIGKRTIRKSKGLELQNRWTIGFDNLDKDGYYIGRKYAPIAISDEFVLNLEPQLLLQRSLKGYTKSYIAEDTAITSDRVRRDASLKDYFALNSSISGNLSEWDIKFETEISTLDTEKLSYASRLSTEVSKEINLFNQNWKNTYYAVYRDRIWNGSIGEAEIYGGYGWKLEKEDIWHINEIKKTQYIGFGLGNFKAEELSTKSIDTSPKGSAFYDLEYKIPTSSSFPESKFVDKSFVYLAEPIEKGTFINAKFSALSNIYENGNHQEYIGFGLGPEFVLGDFKKQSFDYTRFSVIPFYKIKNGDSIFKFDQVNDIFTLKIELDQQLIGPILLKTSGTINLDKYSEDYGDFINSKISLNWKKRSYQTGIFYQPHNESGGVFFTLFGFD